MAREAVLLALSGLAALALVALDAWFRLRHRRATGRRLDLREAWRSWRAGTGREDGARRAVLAAMAARAASYGALLYVLIRLARL